MSQTTLDVVQTAFKNKAVREVKKIKELKGYTGCFVGSYPVPEYFFIPCENVRPHCNRREESRRSVFILVQVYQKDNAIYYIDSFYLCGFCTIRVFTDQHYKYRYIIDW